MKAEWTNKDSLTSGETTKAILVIDAPDDFDAKKIKIGGDGNIYYARDDERASIIGNIRNIKPMPQKMDEFDEDPYHITWFKHGFNTFLEVISKDENI